VGELDSTCADSPTEWSSASRSRSVDSASVGRSSSSHSGGKSPPPYTRGQGRTHSRVSDWLHGPYEYRLSSIEYVLTAE
jgi:hypothetical protein